MVNIQHFTCNDMTQLVKLYMSTGTKVGLAQKHDPRECYTLCLQQRKHKLILQGVYQMAGFETYPLYPK